MAQADFSPILIQGSQIPGRVPDPSLLINDSLFGTELSINSADGKLFFKDPSGNVVVLATLDSAAGKFSALDLTGRLDLKMNTGYNLYGSGTAPNYLAGSLGIGTIPTTSSVLSLTKLISGAISAQGINLNATISSTVTTQAVGIRSLLSTQSGSQTLVSLQHFLAGGTTIGSGSSIVNQYGFAANALTGADNNYAFYANNSYSLGSWNFYSAGTAANYFGGTLGVRTNDMYTFLGDPSITALGDIGVQVVGSGKALYQAYDTGARADKKFITFGNVQGAFVISRMADSYFGALSTPFLIDRDDNITVGGQFNLLNNIGFNIYASGAGKNFMQGALGIGAVPTSSNINLFLNNPATGATIIRGIQQITTVQSDVTGNYINYESQLGTAAATFTTNTVHHYRANQGTFGLGSTVGTQFGFNATSLLIGATNNYGFYSQLPAGTGRFNFYASGTADNVFAGTTSLGGLQGAEALRAVPVASAVNYLQATGGTTGNAATLSAQGSDANINLALTPKGTGNVKFGTHTANAEAAITGYITIKDASGTLRKLAVIS